MKDGNPKSVAIVIIRDEQVHIDATFWEHYQLITDIASEELSSTIISIQGASLNHYQNATTVNVGKAAIVEVNPKNTDADKLRAMDQDEASMNLSQRSEEPSTSHKYSNEQMVSAIKRELSKIEEKEERLKIHKILLENELAIYNAQ